jgi:hypothetical protein
VISDYTVGTVATDLGDVMAQKRKLNVTTIWIALAICCVALIGAAALWA